MMASERPVSPPETEQIETPNSQDVVAPPALPKPTHGKIQPSRFLHGFDVLLAVGLAVLAFAIASFAVRNSDFWLHLGIGKLIAEGNYEFGKAPFSYSGSERYWANHSWLFDLLTFKIYSVGDGEGVVVFKAILVSLLAIVLLSVRKQGQSLWFGVLLIGLAFLAGAPRFIAHPSIFSYLLLGVTIYLLIHQPPGANRWRLPVGLGVAFWLWSNLDNWFVIGLIFVTLYLIGEFLQRMFAKPTEGRERPSLTPVAVGLGVGIVACMLNPHHFHIWELPPDFFPKQLGTTLGKERDLAASFRSAFEKGSFDFDGNSGGNPVNTFAALILLALYFLGLAVNFRSLSWGAALASLGMLFVAAFQVRALPYFAFAAAPITAVNLGNFALRRGENTYTVGTLQLFTAVRFSGRFLLALCGLAALAAAWPGWLQPLGGSQRRMSWDIEPDPSLKKAALLLDQWRKEGKLPPEARTLILDIDLASYCAWFAPQEKSFMDLRLDFHAPEVGQFLTLRRIFIPRSTEQPRREAFDVAQFLREHKITHVLLTSTNRIENLASFETMLGMVANQQGMMMQAKPDFQLCDIAGRVSVFGWRRQQVLSELQYNALLFDPVALAFGPDVKIVPDMGPVSPPEKRRFAEKYLTSISPIADGSEESVLLHRYANFLEAKRQMMRPQQLYLVILRDTIPSIFAAPIAMVGLQAMAPLYTPPAPPELFASSYLAVRRAREGILSSRENGESYRALAEAYGSQQFISIDPVLQGNVVICSYERYFLRATTDQIAADPRKASVAAFELAQRHFVDIEMDHPPETREDRRYDLCLEAFKRQHAIMSMSLNAEQRRAVLPRIESKITYLEKKIHSQENNWLNQTGQITSRVHRGRLAFYRFGLVRRAIEELKKAQDSAEEAKKSPYLYFIGFAELAKLYIITGQPEMADDLMKQLEEYSVEFRKQQNQEAQDLQNQIHIVKLQIALILGRFSEIIQEQIEDESKLQSGLASIERLDLVKPSAKFVGRTMLPLFSAGILALEGVPGVERLELMNKLLPPTNQSDFQEVTAMWGYGKTKHQINETNFRLAMAYLEQGDNRLAASRLQSVADATKSNRGPRQQIMELILRALPKQ